RATSCAGGTSSLTAGTSVGFPLASRTRRRVLLSPLPVATYVCGSVVTPRVPESPNSRSGHRSVTSKATLQPWESHAAGSGHGVDVQGDVRVPSPAPPPPTDWAPALLAPSSSSLDAPHASARAQVLAQRSARPTARSIARAYLRRGRARRFTRGRSAGSRGPWR